MENVLETLTWKYAGFFDVDPDGGQKEIWFLLTDEGDHVARFVRYNDKCIKNHREFIEKQLGGYQGPQFSYHARFKNALPWNEVRSQLGDGSVLFGLSDSGTHRIAFCDVCTLEPVAEIKKELLFTDLLPTSINNCNLDNNLSPVV